MIERFLIFELNKHTSQLKKAISQFNWLFLFTQSEKIKFELKRISFSQKGRVFNIDSNLFTEGIVCTLIIFTQTKNIDKI